jgi:hypothetical protein
MLMQTACNDGGYQTFRINIIWIYLVNYFYDAIDNSFIDQKKTFYYLHQFLECNVLRIRRLLFCLI